MIKEFNKLEYIVNKCPKLFVLFCNSTTISIWNMYDLFSLYISSLYGSKSLRFLLKNFYRFMHIFFSVLSLFMGFLKMILSFKIIKGIFCITFFSLLSMHICELIKHLLALLQHRKLFYLHGKLLNCNFKNKKGEKQTKINR